MIYVIRRRLLFGVTGGLYVVGGWISNNVLWSTVSGYRIMSDANLEGIPVAPMKSARQNPGVTATQTGLIVCGGYDGSPLKTCEIYHQRTNR